MSESGKQELLHYLRTLAGIVVACIAIAASVFGAGAWVLDLQSAEAAQEVHDELEKNRRAGDKAVKDAAHAELRETEARVGQQVGELQGELREDRRATNGRLDAIFRAVKDL